MRCAQYGLIALLMTAIVGCGSSNVEVVDLNKVLDVFASTLDELDKKHSDKGESEVAAVDAADEEDGQRKEFLDLYATNLNKARIIKSAVGVEMSPSGDILGFKDANSNKARDSGEKEIFKLQIDADNSRVIASDGTYYRDHRYRPRAGFFTGYLIGSMLGRNRSYYSGARASSKPNFRNKQMSPKNYHSNAVSKARSKARSRSSSSRSRSGSRGFSFGK